MLRQFLFLILQIVTMGKSKFSNACPPTKIVTMDKSKFSNACPPIKIFTLTEKNSPSFNPRKNKFVKFCYFQPYLNWPCMHLLQDCLKSMRLLWSCYIRLWSTAAIQAWTTVGIFCIATISQSLVLVKMSFKVWSIWSGIITCCFENHSCVKDWKTMQNRVYKTAKWAHISRCWHQFTTKKIYTFKRYKGTNVGI